MKNPTDYSFTLLEGYIVNIFKIIGIVAGVILVAVIAFFVIMRSTICQKKIADYVLKYIKEHKDDETCSLFIKRNGEY